MSSGKAWFDAAAAESALRSLDFRPCLEAAPFDVPQVMVAVRFMPNGRAYPDTQMAWKDSAKSAESTTASACMARLLRTVTVQPFREAVVALKTVARLRDRTLTWTGTFELARTLRVEDRPGCNPPWAINEAGQRTTKPDCTDPGY